MTGAIIPFPSLEEQEASRLSDEFISLHAGNRMVTEIMAWWGLRDTAEEVVKELGMPIASDPIDANRLRLYYPNCMGTIIQRNTMDYEDWCENVARLKKTDPSHAAALEDWGRHHFQGIIQEMLAAFLEERA